MKEAKQIMEKGTIPVIRGYSLEGEPVLKLFNYNWDSGNIEKPNYLITGCYDSFNNDSSFFRKVSANNLHLVKIRSRSYGQYGSGTYGSDEDVIYCEGSFVNVYYGSVNPDFENPKEDASCSIEIFSDSITKIEGTRRVLEEICGDELIEAK